MRGEQQGKKNMYGGNSKKLAVGANKCRRCRGCTSAFTGERMRELKGGEFLFERERWRWARKRKTA